MAPGAIVSAAIAPDFMASGAMVSAAIAPDFMAPCAMASAAIAPDFIAPGAIVSAAMAPAALVPAAIAPGAIVSAAIAPVAIEEKASATAASLRMFIMTSPEQLGVVHMSVRSSTALAIRTVVRQDSPFGYSDLEISFRTFFLACSANPGKNVCSFCIINAHGGSDPARAR
jgi:hypothetical protein